MNRRNRNPLGSTPPFDAAPRSELKEFGSLSTIVTLDDGETLMFEGAFGNDVLILIEGTLDISRGGENIAEVAPGAVVGEQALLLHEPRNATVTASSDCTVAAMTRHEFSSVLDRCPHIAKEILQIAGDRNAPKTS